MSKIANFRIEYYSDTLNKVELYSKFFSQNKIDFITNNDQFSYLIDYDPFYHKLEIGENISDFILNLVENVRNKPLCFSHILDKGIIMNHTINAVKSEEINIAISFPKMLNTIDVPDFSFYAERILPFFDYRNIKCLEFTFC